MTLQGTVFKLLTTRKVDMDKVRRRRERRRRRQAAKERRAERFEAWVAETSFKPRYDDDESSSRYSKDDLPSLIETGPRGMPNPNLMGDDVVHYQNAEVMVGQYSRPFIGKLQETTTPVRVKTHYEWYDLY